jgi:hypothetical protein
MKPLFARNGEFIGWFSTQAKPLRPKIAVAVKDALAT